MGILNNIKCFFNVDGVHIKITDIRAPKFDNNCSISGSYSIDAGFEAHITSIDLIVRAQIDEKDIIFARHRISNEPFTVAKGTKIDKIFNLDGINFHRILQQEGYSDVAEAEADKAIFLVTLEIDVKEAAGLFDPTNSKAFTFAR
jgi:hypothetical protein